MKFTYREIEEAVEFFGLIGLETKQQIKQKYLKLSKQYHPDKLTGDNDKFQQLTKYYKILEFYIDNFKFRFSQEEFQDQYPFTKKENGQWSLW
jgi:preprotein translocase subunit Sec63